MVRSSIWISDDIFFVFCFFFFQRDIQLITSAKKKTMSNQFLGHKTESRPQIWFAGRKKKQHDEKY